MRIFKINEKIEIVCDTKKEGHGFKHEATLLINGSEEETAKCFYLNRTWERFQYQSVLSRIVEKSSVLSKEEKEFCNKFISGDHTDWSGFKQTAMVAKIGELFCQGNKKETNSWKARMIKAGLGNQGLSIPEGWDELSEDEKETRLNKVIELCNKAGGK